MRKPAALLIAAAAVAGILWTGARAQGIDPGISAIVQAIQKIYAATTTLNVTTVPATGGGWTPFLANGLSVSVVTVKGSAGELGAYHCLNNNTAQAYIQIFDTTGAVTLGTTVPVLSLGLPASDGGNLEWSQGIHFANAIKVAATTTATGASPNASAVDCNFAFK